MKNAVNFEFTATFWSFSFEIYRPSHTTSRNRSCDLLMQVPYFKISIDMIDQSNQWRAGRGGHAPSWQFLGGAKISENGALNFERGWEETRVKKRLQDEMCL